MRIDRAIEQTFHNYKIVKKFVPGDSFGEIALISKSQR